VTAMEESALLGTSDIEIVLLVTRTSGSIEISDE
jgi:hypothetical protein